MNFYSFLSLKRFPNPAFNKSAKLALKILGKIKLLHCQVTFYVLHLQRELSRSVRKAKRVILVFHFSQITRGTTKRLNVLPTKHFAAL